MEERKISCSCWERFENACFRNVARYILFDVTLEIVQRNVSDIVHITLLSKSCMVQPLLQIRSLETLQLGAPHGLDIAPRPTEYKSLFWVFP